MAGVRRSVRCSFTKKVEEGVSPKVGSSFKAATLFPLTHVRSDKEI